MRLETVYVTFEAKRWCNVARKMVETTRLVAMEGYAMPNGLAIVKGWYGELDADHYGVVINSDNGHPLMHKLPTLEAAQKAVREFAKLGITYKGHNTYKRMQLPAEKRKLMADTIHRLARELNAVAGE